VRRLERLATRGEGVAPERRHKLRYGAQRACADSPLVLKALLGAQKFKSDVEAADRLRLL
jgi:hypothetical protein